MNTFSVVPQIQFYECLQYKDRLINKCMMMLIKVRDFYEDVFAEGLL